MGMTKQLLNWVDKKFEAVQSGEDTKHPHLKAAALGAVEGFIDGAVLAYPILMAGCIYASKKFKELKNE